MVFITAKERNLEQISPPQTAKKKTCQPLTACLLHVFLYTIALELTSGDTCH